MNINNIPKKSDLPSIRRLRQSTFIATLTALVLMFCAVLPAEYGIDPTGVGDMLGLKRMGEIKVSLAREAEAAEQKKASEIARSPVTERKISGAVTVKEKLPTERGEKTILEHKRVFILQPGQAAEIKLKMKKGAIAQYEWRAEGGRLNQDTHGDRPDGTFKRYSKGRMIKGENGTIIAAFDGAHGWFWRNRDSKPVKVTLITKGEYVSIKRVS